MKTSTFLTAGAVALLAGAAQAQSIQGVGRIGPLGGAIGIQSVTRVEVGSMTNRVDSQRSTAEARGDNSLADVQQGIRIQGGADVRVAGAMSNDVTSRDTRAIASGRGAVATVQQGIDIR